MRREGCGTLAGAMRAASLAQGMSQEKMMLQGTLTNCTPVDFPPAPKVSNEAKVALPTGSLGTTETAAGYSGYYRKPPQGTLGTVDASKVSARVLEGSTGANVRQTAPCTVQSCHAHHARCKMQ